MVKTKDTFLIDPKDNDDVELLGAEIVGNILIGYPKNVSKENVDLIKDIVRKAQNVKPRCKACYPCCMGVTGCGEDRKPHGHGSLKRCPECGVPYAYVHPHSNICSMGTVVSEDVMHDERELHKQLEWIKDRY